jgi:hypothetical protein
MLNALRLFLLLAGLALVQVFQPNPAAKANVAFFAEVPDPPLPPSPPPPPPLRA